MEIEKIEVDLIGATDQIKCINAISQIMENFRIEVWDGIHLDDAMRPAQALSDPEINAIVDWFMGTYKRL